MDTIDIRFFLEDGADYITTKWEQRFVPNVGDIVLLPKESYYKVTKKTWNYLTPFPEIVYIVKRVA